MKPVYISAMFLYLFAAQAEHHNSARKTTAIATAARLHARMLFAVMESFRSAVRTGSIATVVRSEGVLSR
ncbi:hypothetical protein IFM58399_07245 [Aspergillus lentulus]|uniref:uncharacterized protein n=1 Tax=Aspergillus lentulus TaxID=293939 RepID=UPI001395B984|nr:uncharacterized protein IFM58399_07245 [Aspergillus lentulus]GFF44316.1 hypothetical protein IFM58399_07245 [Aspergillus lentulus]